MAGRVYLSAPLGVFAACVALDQWEPLRLAVTPRSIQRARAHEKAVEQFLAQNMHTTRDRTGVLIYVAVAEHYVEIIADDGIDAGAPAPGRRSSPS